VILVELQADLERRKGQRTEAGAQVCTTQTRLKLLVQLEVDIMEAQEILQTVAQATQRELEYHISELVTLAMGSVLRDPYELCLDFVLRRNRSEAVLSFRRPGQDVKLEPYEGGGGAVNIAAMGLRFALWRMQRPGSRPVVVLDEPFYHLNDPTRELHVRAATMLKTISEKLGLQLLIVTLLPELIETADRAFHIARDSHGVSQVEVV